MEKPNRFQKFVSWAAKNSGVLEELLDVVKQPGKAEAEKASDDVVKAWQEIEVTPAEPAAPQPSRDVSTEALRKIALDLRGDPPTLPTLATGEIAAVQARGWIESETRLVAFALLWLGICPDVDDASREALKAVLKWHEIDEVPR